MRSNDWFCSSQSMKFAGEMANTGSVNSVCGGVCHRRITRSASGNGSGFSTTALTTVKMAELTPMPRPRITMPAMANPGLLIKARAPWRMSRTNDSKAGRPRRSRYSSLVCSTPPSAIIARRLASCGVIPARMLSSMCSCRWLSISADNSRSARLPPNTPNTRRNQALTGLIVVFLNRTEASTPGRRASRAAPARPRQSPRRRAARPPLRRSSADPRRLSHTVGWTPAATTSVRW